MRFLAKKRKECDLSQQELATMIGVSRFSVIGYEKSRVSPTMDVAEKIARVLGCSIEDLNPPQPPTTPEDTGAERKTA